MNNNNNNNNSYSHSSNYQDRSMTSNDNNNNYSQQQQISQQFANGVNNQQHHQQQTNQPVTFLSILRDGKIQLGEISNSWNEQGDWLLRSLVMSINQLLSVNDQYPNNHSQFLPEHMKLPMITIEGYIARIIKYSPCSKECFIIILMYIDRLIQKKNFIVNSYNIHRILITCVLVAAKYLDDIFYNNQFYSQVGGVSVKEINIMELDFLKLLSFDVSANTNIYSVYLEYFEKYTLKLQSTLNYQPNTTQLPLPIPIDKQQSIEPLPQVSSFSNSNFNNKNNNNNDNINNINNNNNNNSTNNNIIPNNRSNNNNNNNNNTIIKPDEEVSEDDKSKNNNSGSYHHLPFRFQHPNLVA